MEKNLENQLLTENLYQWFRKEITRIGMEGFFLEYDVLEMVYFLKNNRAQERYKLFVCLAERDINTFVQWIKDKKEIMTLFLKQNDFFMFLFEKVNLETFTILFHEIKTNPSLASINYSFLTVISQEVIKKYLEKDIPLDEVALLVNYNHAIRKDFFLSDARAFPLLCEKKSICFSYFK